MKEIISCLAEFASHWLAEAQYLTSQRQLCVRGPDQAEGQRGERAQRALRPVDVWRTPSQDDACTSLLHNECFSQVWSHYTDTGTGHEVWTYYLTPGYTQVRPLHASWQPLCVLMTASHCLMTAHSVSSDGGGRLGGLPGWPAPGVFWQELLRGSGRSLVTPWGETLRQAKSTIAMSSSRSFWK